MGPINPKLNKLPPMKVRGYPKIGEKWVSKVEVKTVFCTLAPLNQSNIPTYLSFFLDALETIFKMKD